MSLVFATLHVRKPLASQSATHRKLWESILNDLGGPGCKDRNVYGLNVLIDLWELLNELLSHSNVWPEFRIVSPKVVTKKVAEGKHLNC